MGYDGILVYVGYAGLYVCMTLQRILSRWKKLLFRHSLMFDPIESPKKGL